MTSQLYCGDCLEILPTLEAGSIDLILTDPPYNVSQKGSKIIRGNGSIFEGGDISLDFGEWDRNQIKWDEFIGEFVRILKPNGVLVMFYEKLLIGSIGIYLSQEYKFQVRHIGAYIKTNPAPQARKVKWQNGLEFFLIATKNKGMGHHFNFKLGQSPDYFIRSNCYERYGHPTQKPLDLIEWIMRYWSLENDVVLDPFFGSGTTGVAAYKNNRNFIGIERDPTYFSIGEKRIHDAEQQPLLFGGA